MAQYQEQQMMHGSFELDGDALRGADVCDASGDKIGTVDGSYVDTNGTFLRYLTISTGWFGKNRHVVPVDDIRYDAGTNTVVLPYGRDQLQDAPTFDRDSRELSVRDEENIYRHYGRRGYWEAVEAKQTTPSATPEIAQADVAAAMDRQGRGSSEDLGPNDGLESRRPRVQWHDW